MLRQGRYVIERMIGGGGFGQIFMARDTSDGGDAVAVKAEPLRYSHPSLPSSFHLHLFSAESRRIILEQAVLQALHGKEHIPRMIASGQVGMVNYIIMQLLGPNISELRRKVPIPRQRATDSSKCICSNADSASARARRTAWDSRR